MIVTVGFQKNGAAKNVDTGPNITNTDTQVAGRHAVQSTKTVSGHLFCQLLVDIADHSVLDVSVVDAESTGIQPCGVAMQFMNIVIPKVKP